MLDQIFYWTGAVVVTLSAIGGLIFFLYWFANLIFYGALALKQEKFDYISRVYANHFIAYWIDKIEENPKYAGREFLLRFRDGEKMRESDNKENE